MKLACWRAWSGSLPSAPIEGGDVPDVEVGRPKRQGDERMGEVAKPAEPPVREQRLKQRARQAEHDQQRADVRDQQVLRHVAEQQLLTDVRQGREERRRRQHKAAGEAEDPPGRDRPALPREGQGAKGIRGADDRESDDLEGLGQRRRRVGYGDHTMIVGRRTASTTTESGGRRRRGPGRRTPSRGAPPGIRSSSRAPACSRSSSRRRWR